MPQELQCDDGTFTLVDDDYARRLQYFNLRANDHAGRKRPNATRKYVRFSNNTGKGKTLRLHRVIMEWILGRKLEPSEFVDHINGDTLNNTRENLRVATRLQNIHNTTKKMRPGSTSQYKGVRLIRTGKYRNKPWAVRIKHDGKEISVGYFETEREAALAYNAAAKKYFGEFARLNQID